jgi:hypothetical protein
MLVRPFSTDGGDDEVLLDLPPPPANIRDRCLVRFTGGGFSGVFSTFFVFRTEVRFCFLAALTMLNFSVCVKFLHLHFKGFLNTYAPKLAPCNGRRCYIQIFVSKVSTHFE